MSALGFMDVPVLTATNDETAGGRGGDGNGLPGSATDGRVEAVLGGTTARQRSDAAYTRPKKRLNRRKESRLTSVPCDQRWVGQPRSGGRAMKNKPLLVVAVALVCLGAIVK